MIGVLIGVAGAWVAAGLGFMWRLSGRLSQAETKIEFLEQAHLDSLPNYCRRRTER